VVPAILPKAGNPGAGESVMVTSVLPVKLLTAGGSAVLTVACSIVNAGNINSQAWAVTVQSSCNEEGSFLRLSATAGTMFQLAAGCKPVRIVCKRLALRLARWCRPRKP